MKKIVNSLFVLVFGLGLVSGGIVNVEATENKDTTASVTFTPGELELVSATPGINFGETTLVSITDGTKEKYPAVKNDDDSPFAVELTDARGLGKTWTLNAKLSKFTDADDKENETLKGAQIVFNKGEVSSSLNHEPTDNVNGPIELTNNSTVEVYSADSVSNTGKWNFTWDQSNIELYVPAKVAQAGTHEATITWILTDAL